jgi:DNA-binding NarL/FixJ family response regulator
MLAQVIEMNRLAGETDMTRAENLVTSLGPRTIALKPLVRAFRNCFRCGSEFASAGRDRICGDCRLPKLGKNKVLNPQLSFREKQVVKLVSEAKLNKEIAFDLHLSEGTIKEYLNRIFRKLGLTNRTELAVWALTHHLAQSRDEHVA